uniref:Uncharacterized protein n=1 Tax=Anguilla anguilla TaxID=7936 RepID=A0A0E9SZR7_ANGAN
MSSTEHGKVSLSAELVHDMAELVEVGLHLVVLQQ